MARDVTTQVLQTLKSRPQVQTPIATDMFIPNHSGISNHPEFNEVINNILSQIVPVGSILAYGGSTSPSGFLLCDGSAVSRTTYAALFAIVGTTYGTGDGSTTFNVPDARDRFPVGAGSTYTQGTTGGTSTHTHTMSFASGSTAVKQCSNADIVGGGLGQSFAHCDHTHPIVGTTAASAHIPPYIAHQWIIKT